MSQKQYYKDDFHLHGFLRSELKEFFQKLGVDINIDASPLKSPPMDLNEELGRLEPSTDDLKMEVERLKKLISEMKSKTPAMLAEFRDDDPLLLAIQIRNNEWGKYDPDNDRLTRGNQAAIRKSLEEKGFTSRQAESIELVACPIKRG